MIVEGPSDDTALGIALNQVFDRETVYIHIMHGDITSRKGVTSANIVAKIGTEVKTFASSNHYKATDFQQIVHIVDTDGVYISDDYIIEDKSLDKVLYESDGIHTANTEAIKNRNKVKRGNLQSLISKNTIWKIPYSVYYMSCNLDHVLYNKRNSSDDEKENDAYEFAKKYKNDRDGFVKYICKSSFSIIDDYRKSWQHISDNKNSVERYTNLCIAIQKAIDKHT